MFTRSDGVPIAERSGEACARRVVQLAADHGAPIVVYIDLGKRPLEGGRCRKDVLSLLSGCVVLTGMGNLGRIGFCGCGGLHGLPKLLVGEIRA